MNAKTPFTWTGPWQGGGASGTAAAAPHGLRHRSRAARDLEQARTAHITQQGVIGPVRERRGDMVGGGAHAFTSLALCIMRFHQRGAWSSSMLSCVATTSVCFIRHLHLHQHLYHASVSCIEYLRRLVLKRCVSTSCEVVGNIRQQHGMSPAPRNEESC